MPVLEFVWVMFIFVAGGFGCVRIAEFVTNLFFNRQEYVDAADAKQRWVKTVDKPRAAFAIALMAILVVGIVLTYKPFEFSP